MNILWWGGWPEVTDTGADGPSWYWAHTEPPADPAEDAAGVRTLRLGGRAHSVARTLDHRGRLLGLTARCLDGGLSWLGWPPGVVADPIGRSWLARDVPGIETEVNEVLVAGDWQTWVRSVAMRDRRRASAAVFCAPSSAAVGMLGRARFTRGERVSVVMGGDRDSKALAALARAVPPFVRVHRLEVVVHV